MCLSRQLLLLKIYCINICYLFLIPRFSYSLFCSYSLLLQRQKCIQMFGVYKMRIQAFELILEHKRKIQKVLKIFLFVIVRKEIINFRDNLLTRKICFTPSFLYFKMCLSIKYFDFLSNTFPIFKKISDKLYIFFF